MVDSARLTSSLYRTLRAIRDGHLTLYVQVARFDPNSGKPCPPREVDTAADRAPAGVTLKSTSGWWQKLAADGWLRLPEPGEPQIWMLTTKAMNALAEHHRENA